MILLELDWVTPLGFQEIQAANRCWRFGDAVLIGGRTDIRGLGCFGQGSFSIGTAQGVVLSKHREVLLAGKSLFPVSSRRPRNLATSYVLTSGHTEQGRSVAILTEACASE